MFVQKLLEIPLFVELCTCLVTFRYLIVILEKKTNKGKYFQPNSSFTSMLQCSNYCSLQIIICNAIFFPLQSNKLIVQKHNVSIQYFCIRNQSFATTKHKFEIVHHFRLDMRSPFDEIYSNQCRIRARKSLCSDTLFQSSFYTLA